MNIPTFLNDKYIDEAGYLTSSQQIFNDQLNQAMQASLSDNGWTLPLQTTTNINTIAPTMPNGTMWYDSDTDEFKVTINGTVKVVTVS
jgi:hypothetical protein